MMTRPSSWLACRLRRPEAPVRLFRFPHCGGSVGEYVRCADQLPDVEVWGVQLPGRGARAEEAPFTRVRELVDTLAGEGLAGLKDSTGSPERHAEYLDVAQGHDGFRLFVGSERLVGQSLEGKGAGSISALANVHAPLLLQLAEEGSDVAQAAVDRAQAQTPDIPSLKRAVAERLVESARCMIEHARLS